ncbi:uncharacterized protein [Amphiura filiformis]|uniref:uncharacterized protein n=1 Tax=Amphiura filiformis TaxID=82378 RepID=UPI003B223069
MDFFLRLETHGKLSPDDYEELVELLNDVNRKDLVKELEDAMRSQTNGPTSPESPGSQQTPLSPPRSNQFEPPVTSTSVAEPNFAKMDLSQNTSAGSPAGAANSTATANGSPDSLGYHSFEDVSESAKGSANTEMKDQPMACKEEIIRLSFIRRTKHLM